MKTNEDRTGKKVERGNTDVLKLYDSGFAECQRKLKRNEKR